MKVDTIKGSSYAVTCTKACTVRAVLNTGGDSMLILEAQEKGQHGFTAPTDSVEVSVGDALITKASKTAVPGLSVPGRHPAGRRCRVEAPDGGARNFLQGPSMTTGASTFAGRGRSDGHGGGQPSLCRGAGLGGRVLFPPVLSCEIFLFRHRRLLI